MRNPSGLPEIASPLMNRALVNADATVVSSLIVTLAGGLLPTTNSSAMAGLSLSALLCLSDRNFPLQSWDATDGYH